MNRTINKALADIRHALQECGTCGGGVGVTGIVGTPMLTVASGTPTLGASCGVTSNPQKNEDPPEMKNVEDELDHLDKYLKTLADLVLNGYDTDPDTAVTIVFAAITDLVNAGLLPALPGADASPESLMLWVEKAKKSDLMAKVSNLAFEQSEEMSV
jgi:hypothetical protein